MSSAAVTLDEIASVIGKTKSVVQKQAADEGWAFVEQKTRSRFPKRVYTLATLPKTIRTAIALKAGKTEAAQLYEAQMPKLSPSVQADVAQFHDALPEKPTFVVDWEHFRRKTAKQQGDAYDKAAVVVQLKRLVEVDRLAVFNGSRKTPLNTLIQQVAAANPEVCQSWRTLQNWWLGKPGKPGCVNFDAKDYAAVLAGSYTGRTAVADCSPLAFEYYMALYLHRRQPTHSDCYRRLADKADAEGWVIPCAATLKRRLEKEYSTALIVYMREGDEALRKLSPFVERDKSEFRAGEAVSGDGLKFDKLWVKFPDGEIINTATAWFWQDIYSGKIVAWRLGKTESTDLFRLATYDLTGHFLPRYTQIDNTRVAANKMMTGQAEGRHRFGNQPNDPMGMLVMLDMGAHFTLPDHTVSSPGSKPVERAFGIGGLHDKVATNPAIRDRGYSQATAISSEELRAAIDYEVTRHNAQEKRRSKVCAGVLSFNQAFEKSFTAWAPRKATEAQRRLLMLSIEVAKANSQNGMVTIKAGRSQYGKNRYWCEALQEFRGHNVAVFFDPDDLTTDVDIYSLDGRFLTSAQYEATVAFTDKDAGAEYQKRTQRLKKLAKKQAKEVEAIQKLHQDNLPALAEPEKADSKVVQGLFNKPLAQGFEGESTVIDADALFSKAMKMMGGN